MEVRIAASRLKRNKAIVPDKIPAEYWKAICSDEEASGWATELCNACWEQKEMPAHWSVARVTALFKKGDPALCENYRPISLTCLGYKLLVTILLLRLRRAGAEARNWSTQFGFRSGVGTADALFMARRRIEPAQSTKDGTAVLLALDWAKAFDGICPNTLATSPAQIRAAKRVCG